MATSLPYLVTSKNLPALFEKINSAKIPETGFTHNFLQTTLGFKGTNDRAFIPLLRNLGFIDQANIPTASYRQLKGHRRKEAIAEGIRRAYQALFDADQGANKLSGEKLKGLVAQVAGTDSDLTNRIANTFLTLVNIADFDSSGPENEEKKGQNDASADSGNGIDVQEVAPPKPRGLRTEFHYNIQIQLPSNGTRRDTSEHFQRYQEDVPMSMDAKVALFLMLGQAAERTVEKIDEIAPKDKLLLSNEYDLALLVPESRTENYVE